MTAKKIEADIINFIRENGQASSSQIGEYLTSNKWKLTKWLFLMSGNLWISLYNLEQQGKLTSYWGKSKTENGWHRRRIYKINVDKTGPPLSMGL